MFTLFSPFIIAKALWGILFCIAVWLVWKTRGRDVLLVYSDSPAQREYVEKEIIPRIKDRAVVLNWSKRKAWKLSLAVLASWHFGGQKNFNPLVVVFRPFRLAKVFRFNKPFIEFKHGKPDKVEQMKAELFNLLKLSPSD